MSKEQVTLAFSFTRSVNGDYRIRLTSPTTGLYVSSKDRGAAQFNFLAAAFIFISKRQLIKPDEDESELLCQKGDVDWNETLRFGRGEVVFQMMSPEEAWATLELEKGKGGPRISLAHTWFKNLRGEPFCIIHDKDAIDPWVREALEEDLRKHRR